MTVIERIQTRYTAQCNGDWEHQYGVSIETLDNPGWTVCIDLTGTNLQDAAMIPYRHDVGDNDWASSEIKDHKFTGSGDPNKLGLILEIFASLLSDNS